MSKISDKAIKVYVVGANDHSNGGMAVTSMFYKKGYSICSRIHDADIVVFIGGFDIDPKFYREETNPNARVHTYAEHDKRDKNAWDQTSTKQLKIGICRGGQFLNVMNGGRLYQHVDNHAKNHIIYDALFNKEIEVTSSHHQMMIPSLTGTILAYSEGIVKNALTGDVTERITHIDVEPEVVWYEKSRCLCYQPHPEWDHKNEQEYFFDLVEIFR